MGEALRQRLHSRSSFSLSIIACGTVQDQLATGAHDLGGTIDEFTPHRGSVAGQGQDVPQVIFLESLEQKETHHHQVIVGLVGGKRLERELLTAQLF